MSRLAAFYRATAIVVLNLIALFIVVNVVAALGLSFREYVKHWLGDASPVLAKYGAALAQAYPNRSLEDINELLAATWNRPLVYAPFVEFHEGPVVSRFVNVGRDGRRLERPAAPWPPSTDRFNIFVFGGSTIFGYGVADDETIPAALGRLVPTAGGRPAQVYNLGQAYYGSTQERIFFQQLLLGGIRPSLAVFVDGFNDSILPDEPLTAPRLREAMSEDLAGRVRWMLASLPITRVLAWLSDRLVPPEPAAEAMLTGPMVEARLARYWANVDMIAATGAAARIPVFFVWQPAAPYATEPEADPFYARPGLNDALKDAFAALKPRFAERLAPGRGTWCADVPKGRREVLYVDAAHYSARMSELVADCIRDGLKAASLVP